MMVSGARKGFWGVPPYERLGGRGIVSVPQMVKGRSLRLIALGVLLCCASRSAAAAADARAGACLWSSPAALKARKGALRICGGCRRDLLVYARQGNPDKPSCRLRSRPGRTPGSTACSLARGRLYAPPFPPPRRSPFSAARRSGARRGDGRKTCCRGRRRIGTS